MPPQPSRQTARGIGVGLGWNAANGGAGRGRDGDDGGVDDAGGGGGQGGRARGVDASRDGRGARGAVRHNGRAEPGLAGEGVVRGGEYVTINPLEGGGTSRLRRLQVAADAPVFGARRLRSRGPGENKWESPVAREASGVDKI